MFMSYPSIPTDSLPQGRTNFTANVVWQASASVSEMKINFLDRTLLCERHAAATEKIHD